MAGCAVSAALGRPTKKIRTTTRDCVNSLCRVFATPGTPMKGSPPLQPRPAPDGPGYCFGQSHAPRSADVVVWRDGRMAGRGGTWLFSEPQPAVRPTTSRGLSPMGALECRQHGLYIAATCTVARLNASQCAGRYWRAGFLLRQRAVSLASFKDPECLTVAASIPMSLPAWPMISLATGLEGMCRVDAAREPVLGLHRGSSSRNMNVLGPEYLRAVELPGSALHKHGQLPHARRSRHSAGRAARSSSGYRCWMMGTFSLRSVTATVRPIRRCVPRDPTSASLPTTLGQQIPG